MRSPLAQRVQEIVAAIRATPGARFGVALRWVETGEEVMVGRTDLATFDYVRDADRSDARRSRG